MVMTGHTFQELVEDDELRAALTATSPEIITIARRA
ncbi:hypothetical protein HRbin26_01828 [bacterium HR26]|nr:hypothetical protein HRbin26_01828 [bacterium HR26]